MLFPFKFTSWLTEALLSSVYFSQRNRPRIGNKQRMYVSAVTKLVYWDASRKISVRLYTFVASYFICFRSRNTSWQVTSVVHQKYRKTIQTRVLSVCPDETFPKYRKKLYFYKETYWQRRAEWNTWGVSRSVTVAEVALRQGLIHLRPD